MDHRAALILAVSLFCGSVHAGYAQLAPPEGWSGGGGAAATYRYPSAANAASYSGGAVKANAILNVGGKAVMVPASMRMASNAGRIAAAAIFLHPGLRTVAAVAGWLGLVGLVYDVASGLWKVPDTDLAAVSDGYYYTHPYGGNQQFSNWDDACLSAKDKYVASNPSEDIGGRHPDYLSRSNCAFIADRQYKKSFVINSNPSSCPSGWYVTPAGCVQTPPMKVVTKEEFEQMVPDARPMPPELPGVVWPATWPVEVPEIQPMFIPTGNPVKNPAYDPAKPTSPENQPWLQPGVKLSPAPTPSSPWNVDLQPVNRPVDKPNPNPDPVVDPVPNPDGSGNTDKPRDPEKDQRDLCEKYPEILACQKLDEPEDPGELKTKAVDLDFQVQGGYAGAAVCPAPMTYQAFDRVLTLSWQPFCDSLAMVKNLLLAFAWISAAFILLGAKKE